MREIKILETYLGRCAKEYNSSGVISCLDSLIVTYEAFKDVEYHLLGVKLANIILDSHMIQVSDRTQFDLFWITAARDLTQSEQ